ncbi:MAG: helix-turn-helix domain-containing protein [Mesorhizobium sp.]|nr:MAG: helix-turn-helix domain-containing protein [Mesorhizobium sp.]
MSRRPEPSSKPVLIDVILADGFSMLTTTLILEALRFVNLAHRRKAFDWSIRGVQSQSPRASNGFTFSAQRSFDGEAEPAELVFLNASYFPDAAASPELLAWLRNAARHGAWIAAVDTAPLLLAQAGLLYRKKAAVHWEELESAQERFPDVDFRTSGVEQSGRLFTCSGGMAVLDLMLRLIAQHQGEDIARYVRECFFLKDAETNLLVRDRKLALALSVMRQFIDAPLALEEVAARCNMSPRQMQRRFVAEFGVPPSSFYTALRLQKAQSLLVGTHSPIATIAFGCGYASPSHFTHAYRSFFGISPQEERARIAAGKARSQNRLAMFFQPSSSLLVDVLGPGLTP